MVLLNNKLNSLLIVFIALLFLPLSAQAENLVASDGTPLETLFQISPSGKKIICAGLIKNRYVSGRTKTLNDLTMFFTLTEDLTVLKKKLKATTKAAAKTKLKKKISDTSKRISSENKSCAAGPYSSGKATATPVSGNPGTTPTSTPSPIATATPSSNGNFDSQGNVTAQGKTRFGIPSNFSANSYDGANVWNASCKGCHASQKTGSSFSFYKSAIKLSPMFITNKSDQEIANLTAYLRRSETQ